MTTVAKTCHNCRKRRLRCDRSLPECLKCTRAGRKCLGYGQLLRWTDPRGSHGQWSNQTAHQYSVVSSVNRVSHEVVKCDDRGEVLFHPDPAITLVDPLLQDLNPSSRQYLYYYTSRFCQDLVVHDSACQGGNPFRELMPMSQRYPYLQNIIIAVSAVHCSRAATYACEETKQCSSVATIALVDALRARQKAIHQLLEVLQCRHPAGDSYINQDENEALLATVLFFINFAIIDSGKEGWKSHLKAAGRLLQAQGVNPLSILSSSNDVTSAEHEIIAGLGEIGLSGTKSKSPETRPLNSCTSLSSPLRACDFIVSDTTAYFIWNSAIESLSSSAPRSESEIQTSDWDMNNILDILLRTEANSYHSCPAYLMHIVLRTSHLARAIKSNNGGTASMEQMDQCIALLKEVQSFDVNAWAADVCARNSGILNVSDDLELKFRGHVGATYRASVCLYILLIAPGLPAELRRRQESEIGEILSDITNSEEFASTILQQLSFIPKESPLFKYTTWPIFLAGVETASPARRAWVLDRLRAMRTICPWGMLTAAMETLVDVWKFRDSLQYSETFPIHDVAAPGGFRVERRATDGHDWLVRLKGIRINCLIV
ncbi:fungal-specific transcription factor domain-containing protein [Xylariaceae sp. FL0016]|nr:fungal-specific transcription factor domain-containing protein [Xylariaceae sp. FL0016]